MKRIAAILGIFLICAGPAAGGDTSSSAASPTTVIQQGQASVYSDKFQGRPTASGELHDQNALTAASRNLPLGATAMVTNLENGRSVEVEITDRGPYARGRVIDLSKRAAATLGIRGGTARVRVETHAGDQPTQDLQDQVAALVARGAAKSDAKTSAQERH